MTITGFAALISAVVAVRAEAPGVTALTEAEMKWSSQGALALPGLEQVNLIGDPNKAGPYTLRLKFPAGFKIGPHTHPDSREVTILSGTWTLAMEREQIQQVSRHYLLVAFIPSPQMLLTTLK